jgi:hypothetical protein
MARLPKTGQAEQSFSFRLQRPTPIRAAQSVGGADDESVSFTTTINRRNSPRPVRRGVRWSRARGLWREVQVE